MDRANGSTFNGATLTYINNYACSIGDDYAPATNGTSVRGVFPATNGIKMSEITDGTSNTLLFSEHLRANLGMTTVVANQVEILHGTATSVTGLTGAPALCRATAAGRYFLAGQVVKGRFGSLWMDGQPERVAFNTILPPNSPSCAMDANVNADSVNVVLSAGSRHTGGVNTSSCDGSVRFISSSIDTGNLNIGQPTSGASNYGAWGALGSKSGGEVSQTAD